MIFFTGRGVLDSTQMTYPIGSMYHIYLTNIHGILWVCETVASSAGEKPVQPGVQGWREIFLLDRLTPTPLPSTNCSLMTQKYRDFTYLNVNQVKSRKYRWSCVKYINIWMFPKIEVPQNGWLRMENPIKPY